MITITDAQGNTIAWSSSGTMGFKGSRKSTPYAAQMAAEDAGKKAMEHGMKMLEVEVMGPGSGRESALRALQAVGFQITSIRDVTSDPAQRLPAAQAPPGLSAHGGSRAISRAVLASRAAPARVPINKTSARSTRGERIAEELAGPDQAEQARDRPGPRQAQGGDRSSPSRWSAASA